MSKKDPERIYIDSCIAIEMAKRMLNLHRPEREQELWFVRKMLKACEDREIELMTSSLTAVEAVSLGNDEKGTPIDCPKDVQEFLVSLLTSGTLVKLVQPSLFVAEYARDLRWVHGLTLRPFDALHVASALDSHCKELITFDGRMNKRPEEIAKLADLDLRVILPSESTILPGDYRQQLLELAPANPAKRLAPPPVN